MKTKTVYTSDDGKDFATQEACREHEQTLEFGMIEGLSADDIKTALAGKKPELGLAIERLGRKLGEVRIAAGGSMRKKKVAAPPPDTGKPGKGAAAGQGSAAS